MATIEVRLFSDPRYEDLTAEASVDGKFLLAIRLDEPGKHLVEIRGRDFVPEHCVDEIELDVLLEAIAQAKRALAPGYQ